MRPSTLSPYGLPTRNGSLQPVNGGRLVVTWAVVAAARAALVGAEVADGSLSSLARAVPAETVSSFPVSLAPLITTASTAMTVVAITARIARLRNGITAS